MIENFELSDVAKKTIAGLLNAASALTAFWQHNPNFLFAFGSSSGSSHHDMLG
jgi:hypothetical protein